MCVCESGTVDKTMGALPRRPVEAHAAHSVGSGARVWLRF